MRQEDGPESEAARLRDRLSRLSEASLRINQSLDLETVLQGVLDSACSLTNARYGVITTLDESGEVVEFLTSGLAAAEGEGLWSIPQALRVFEYLSRLPQTLIPSS
jgi:GAF domain-containing protein